MLRWSEVDRILASKPPALAVGSSGKEFVIKAEQTRWKAVIGLAPIKPDGLG
jgi:hypothetical protein